MTVTRTLPADLRGEAALSFLPAPSGPAGEVMILGEALEQIDAYGAAVLRAAIEYHCRHLQRRMTVSLPRAKASCDLFHGLLRDDHPAHLVLPNDSGEQRSPLPEAVLLQAIPVGDATAGQAAAIRISERAGTGLRAPARFLAKSLLELRDNSARHAERCPLPPVACALREGAELQLAVCDLGSPHRAFDPRSLTAALRRGGTTGGVASIGAQAEQRGMEFELTVAAGSGRARWQEGEWVAESDAQVQGFCVCLRIQS